MSKAGVALCVIALGAAAWLLLGRGEDEGDPAASITRPPGERASEDVASLRGSAAPERDGTAGASDATQPVLEDEDAESLRGVVVDTEGHPLKVAAVFLLPKGVPGLNEEAARSTGLVRALTSEDGRFDLGRRDVSGHWIGAVAPGHLPSHLDGDAFPGGEAVLRLEPGPTVRVTVTCGDEGPLTLDTTISVEPTGDAWAWPAPQSPWYFEAEGAIEEGTQEIVIPVGTKEEVEVSAHYRSVMPVIEPHRPRVTPPADVTFRILMTCTLDIQVIDAGTKEPLARGFHYWLLLDGTTQTGGSTSLGGQMQVAHRLPPAPYTVRVEAVGYVPATVEVEGLDRYGDHASVEVTLERDPTLGSLRIRIPRLAELPRIAGPEGRERAPPPFVLFRRPQALAPSFVQLMDPKEAPAWGTLMGASRGESETDHVWEAVRSGTVTALIAEAASRTVAVIPEVRIPEGGSTSVVADLLPGIMVELAPLAPGAAEIPSLTVRHPLYGALPTYWTRHAESSWSDPGHGADPAWTIGPYPGPEIEVLLRDAKGVTKTHTIRLEEKDDR